MTIASTARKAGPLLGTGAQTSFPFAFKVFADGDLLVARANVLGLETALVLDTDYSVTLNSNQETSPGGAVTLVLAPAVGEKITIVGDVDYDQVLDLPSGGNFSPLALENQLDRMTMQIQQLREVVGRTLRTPVTSTASTVLPAPEAQKIIGWDVNGSGLQNYDIPDLFSGAVYADWVFDSFTGTGSQTIFSLQRAPGAVGNCDVSVDGQTYVPNVDFSLSGATLAFTAAPILGAEILVRYGSAATQVASAFSVESQVATAAQTVFTLADVLYTPGTNSLAVYVNGLFLTSGVDFLEADYNQVTFTSGLSAGDEVRFIAGRTINDTIGAEVVSYRPAGTGAVATTAQAKLRESVSVKDFGAVGDGVTDDTAAFVAAMASLGSKGGCVTYHDKHRINTSITVPPSVCIVGPYGLAGIATNNLVAPYGNMAALVLSSSATINLSGGAGISGSLIYRAGMTFPALDSSSFAGTAVTVSGDDTFVLDSMVLGFNKAFYSSGFQRQTLRGLRFDCNNGIEIAVCYDIAYVTECHGWPFATIATYQAGGGVTKSIIQRSGTAFKFFNGGDWNKATNCFGYGYYRGFWVSGCNSMTLLGCGADSTGSYAGQLGFVVDGNSEDTRLTLCQTAAQETGYYISTAVGVQTRMLNCDSWACSGQGVIIAAGDVSITGGVHRNTLNGVTVSNAVSSVFADKIRFKDISNLPFNITVANADISIGDDNDYGNFNNTTAVAGINKASKTVASADPLPLYPNSKFLQVSGTTNFGTIDGGYAGRELTLLFLGALTVFDGGANLKLNGNLVTAPNTTLTLVHTGVHWVEKSRSVN